MICRQLCDAPCYLGESIDAEDEAKATQGLYVQVDYLPRTLGHGLLWEHHFIGKTSSQHAKSGISSWLVSDTDAKSRQQSSPTKVCGVSKLLSMISPLNLLDVCQ